MTLNVQMRPTASTADHAAQPEKTSQPVADPLTDCLLFLAAHHGRAISRNALLAGLPIADGKLTVGLFDRAAKRAGLEPEAVKRAIADIPALVLPAVLIMRDGSTRVLVENSGRPKDAKVINPSSPAKPTRGLPSRSR